VNSALRLGLNAGNTTPPGPLVVSIAWVKRTPGSVLTAAPACRRCAA
jgi:hypothetical protein